VKPSQAAAALELYVAANQPAFVHGSPGGGKSAIAHQLAEKLGWPLIDMRLSQLESVDLRGIPYRDMEHNITRWAANSQLPDIDRHGPNGILFLDEMNSAAKSTMAAAYQLVLDRRLGEYKVPLGWSIIAAGNLVTDRSIVEAMPTALKNRFAHIMFETDHEDWCTWAITKDVSLEVLGFIRFRPHLLNDFAKALNDERQRKKGEKTEKGPKIHDLMAFATPRSWEFVDKMVKKGVPGDLEFDIYSGIVGEGPASEFLGYLKHHRNIPNIDALLLAPDKAKVPQEPGVLYALSTGLAARATVDNIERIIQYIGRIPPEFAVMTIKDASTRNNEICTTKPFNVWATKNANVLI
jgi:hypothetical protein